MMKCFFPISVQEMWLCCMSVIMTWIMRPINGFKGNIEQITDTELRIRLRATQRNASVFLRTVVML